MLIVHYHPLENLVEFCIMLCKLGFTLVEKEDSFSLQPQRGYRLQIYPECYRVILLPDEPREDFTQGLRGVHVIRAEQVQGSFEVAELNLNSKMREIHLLPPEPGEKLAEKQQQIETTMISMTA